MCTLFVLVLPTFGCARVTTKTAGSSRPYEAEIQPESGSSWGDWVVEEFCPEGSFAKGVQLKVESKCGAFCDDTAINGIKLFCESSSGTDMEEVRSSVGLYGDWQTPLLCHGEEEAVAFLRGVQFRSEKETKAKGNP